MILLDTSAWIEWLTESSTGELVGSQLPDRSEWIVPTIVQFEMAKWITREIGPDESEWFLALTEDSDIVALDTAIAIAAAEVSREHGLSTADAIILATAHAEGAALLTCDKDFAGLPGVEFIGKVLH